MTPTFRRATAADVPAAARTLAAAFHDYPWTRWAVPEDDYPERLAALQEIYLEHALAHGIVVVHDPADAVVALMPPDAPAPPDDVQERVAALHGPRLQAVAAAELPPSPPDAWTLATVGVLPSLQGTGLGSAACRAALRDPALRDAPVALETSDARNVTFYERLGFVRTATTQVHDGPVVHGMVRTPTP